MQVIQMIVLVENSLKYKKITKKAALTIEVITNAFSLIKKFFTALIVY
jgi:hypothetical protein